MEYGSRALGNRSILCSAESKTANELFLAVVYVDGTARLQLVSQSDDSAVYFILKSYKEITGYPILVNTGFNIHEEPIVMSAEDAIESFLRAKLDVISIGQFLLLNQTTTKQRPLK